MILRKGSQIVAETDFDSLDINRTTARTLVHFLAHFLNATNITRANVCPDQNKVILEQGYGGYFSVTKEGINSNEYCRRLGLRYIPDTEQS